MGAGVFVITGVASAQYAGPAVSLSFLVAALVVIMIAFCYAELNCLIPAGGAYSYAYVIFGEVVAWIVISLFFAVNILGCAYVASGFSEYIASMLQDFGIVIPVYFLHGPTTKAMMDNVEYNCLLDLPATALIAVCAFLLLRSVKSSAAFNNVLVFIKMGVMLLFVIFGAYYVAPDLWSPYIPENTGEIGKFGWSGVVGGAAIIFVAYNGFDVIVAASQEAKNPKRDVPLAVIIAILVCAAFYCCTTVVLTGLVHYKDLGVPDPMSLAMHKIPVPGFSLVNKLGIIIALFTVEMTTLYTITRIVLVVIKDGLLPARLGGVDGDHGVPKNLTVFMATLVFMMVNLMSIKAMAEMASLSVLLVSISVCIMTIYLRYTKPQLDREFRVPFMPILPIVAIAASIWMLLAIDIKSWRMTAIYMVVMLLIYLVYGVKNSEMAQEPTVDRE